MTETSPARWRFHEDGSLPRRPETIFVFGSNLAGRHGKGAALVARQRFGAVRGQGEGPMGRAYAIPTKTGDLVILSVEEIAQGVARFVAYAHAHPELRFFVTRVGCGLAGWPDETIAPLFAGCPAHCSFARQWEPLLVGAPASHGEGGTSLPLAYGAAAPGGR